MMPMSKMTELTNTAMMMTTTLDTAVNTNTHITRSPDGVAQSRNIQL